MFLDRGRGRRRSSSSATAIYFNLRSHGTRKSAVGISRRDTSVRALRAANHAGVSHLSREPGRACRGYRGPLSAADVSRSRHRLRTLPRAWRIARRQPHDVADGPNIVNPRDLTPVLREDVCQQCHLLGQKTIDRRGHQLADYRPGLSLAEFVTVFSRPSNRQEGHTNGDHVEQMSRSRCFRAVMRAGLHLVPRPAPAAV